MALPTSFNYKTEAHRYRYYYRRLQVFYQKPSIQVSAAVLFALFTIIFFAVFAIKPTLVTIAELLKKIDTQKQTLVQAKTKAAALATAQQQYSQILPNLPLLDQAIPNHYQLQSLLTDLEASIAELSLPISNLRFSPLTYPASTTVPSASTVQEIPFSLSFDAPYPAAKTVITRLNQLPRLIQVDSVSIGRPQSSRRSLDSSTLQISLNCRTFYYP